MATSKKPRAIETGQGHSTGANRAAASRAKPKPEAWAKAVDKYWNPKVKIAGVALPGSRLRYPKNDPKKNFVMNQLTSKERRKKAMDAQYDRYSK
jgi:hypothetical protein